MASGDQEIEVKFLLKDLAGLEQRLRQLGAEIAAERVHELNLRFDTPGFILRNGNQVLRLRQDAHSVMTYKGPGRSEGGAMARQEIEFQVSDFGAARRLLEALGYRVTVMYEKYRATYRLGSVLVTLDEMPYGTFAEIESAGTPETGSASDALRAAAGRLGLDWNQRCTTSYLGLFDRLRTMRGLPARNLMFEEFAGLTVTPDDLGLQFADH